MTRRLTAREITSMALQLVGKFGPNDTAPEGHDVLRGLDWLDQTLASMMAERWVVQLTSKQEVTVPLKANQMEYDLIKFTGPVDGIAYPLTSTLIDASGQRWPFRLCRLDEWERDRTAQTMTGMPMFGHLDRSQAATLRIWPLPTEDGQYSVEMTVCSYPPTVAALPRRTDRNTGNVDIGLRPEWNLWAVYDLAYHIGNGPIVKLPTAERTELLTFAENKKEALRAYVEQEMPIQAPISDAWDPYGPSCAHPNTW